MYFSAQPGAGEDSPLEPFLGSGRSAGLWPQSGRSPQPLLLFVSLQPRPEEAAKRIYRQDITYVAVILS